MSTPLPDLHLSPGHTPPGEPAAADATAPSLARTAAAGPFMPNFEQLWDDIHGSHELPPSEPIAALEMLLSLADIPPLPPKMPK